MSDLATAATSAAAIAADREAFRIFLRDHNLPATAQRLAIADVVLGTDRHLSADDVARARPVLDVLCRRVEHVGDHGAAASLKLAINLPLLVFWQSFGEANALVRHLGLDPAWLVDLFADTSGAPAVLKNRGKAIAATLAGSESSAVSFDIDSIRKDLSTMVAEAGSRNVALPAAAAALASFDEASAAGWGERDCTWLPAFWASKADHQQG